MKVVVKRKGQNVPVRIDTEFIKLESAMKLANTVPSGGVDKVKIQGGEVMVNGEVCTMRGKKLRPGDVFSCMEGSFVIEGNGAE